MTQDQDEEYDTCSEDMNRRNSRKCFTNGPLPYHLYRQEMPPAGTQNYRQFYNSRSPTLPVLPGSPYYPQVHPYYQQQQRYPQLPAQVPPPYCYYPHQAYMMPSENMALKRPFSSVVGSDDSEPQLREKKARKAKRKCASASSIYKGVSWHKRDECYMARVWVDAASKHIGSYKQEMKAAIEVDKALKKLGRDKTHMNFSSNLERDIALSILKNNETTTADTSSGSVDNNGFPNTIEIILTNVVKSVQSRKVSSTSPATKEKKSNKNEVNLQK